MSCIRLYAIDILTAVFKLQAVKKSPVFPCGSMSWWEISCVGLERLQCSLWESPILMTTHSPIMLLSILVIHLRYSCFDRNFFFIRNCLEGYFETRNLDTTKDELTFYRFLNILVSLCFHVREILDVFKRNKKNPQSAVNRQKKQFCNVV